MNADETVRELMLTFPEMCGDRYAALNFIFRGGSYQWSGGDIISDFDCVAYRQDRPNFTDPDLEVERLRAAWWEDEMRARKYATPGRADREPSEYDIEAWLETARATTGLVGFVHDNVDFLLRTGVAPSFVNWDKYSALANIPDDASDSWLDAADEVARFTLDCRFGGYLYPSDIAPRPASETSDAVRELLDEIAGEIAAEIRAEAGLPEPAPKDPAQVAAQAALEREQRFAAEARTVEGNHIIAREALRRTAELRTAHAC